MVKTRKEKINEIKNRIKIYLYLLGKTPLYKRKPIHRKMTLIIKDDLYRLAQMGNPHYVLMRRTNISKKK